MAPKRNKSSYATVRFLEDGIVYVCSTSKFSKKKSGKPNQKFVRYSNGISYEAEILFVGDKQGAVNFSQSLCAANTPASSPQLNTCRSPIMPSFSENVQFLTDVNNGEKSSVMENLTSSGNQNHCTVSSLLAPLEVTPRCYNLLVTPQKHTDVVLGDRTNDSDDNLYYSGNDSDRDPLYTPDITELNNSSEDSNDTDHELLLSASTLQNNKISRKCQTPLSDLEPSTSNYVALQEGAGLNKTNASNQKKSLLYPRLSSVSAQEKKTLNQKSKTRQDDDSNSAETCINSNISLQYPVLPPNLKQYEAYLPKYVRPSYQEPPCGLTVESASLGKNSLRYFCPYCCKNVAQLPRHLEALHKGEELVTQVIALPKRDSERKNMLMSIRIWGNAMFNDNRSYNNGILRVTRRQPGLSTDDSHYVACPHCTRMFYKRRFGRHVNRCSATKIEVKTFDHFRAGQALTNNVHSTANDIMRYRVFPYLKNDENVDAIRFDRAIIAYGNYLCLKFATSPHHDKMIRARIRHLGRLLLEARRQNNIISDLASLFHPCHVDLIANSIRTLAGFKALDGNYRCPATATLIISAVKAAADQWTAECIATANSGSEKNVERFKLLFNIRIAPVINKTVTENRCAVQRKKKVMLPSKDDLKRFDTYLQSGYQRYVRDLQQSFSFENWKLLGAFSLVYIVYFNKRRPGEIERTYINNYETLLELNSENDSYNDMTTEERSLAERYKLFVIRGKLNRTVNVVLNNEVKEALDLFVSLRKKAGVSEANPYLFGLPSTNNMGVFRHLNAYEWVRIFSVKCNAVNPQMLRCTVLRKSLATLASNMNLPEKTVSDLADHMGHHSNIHKNIYRQPTYERSVIGVLATLEKAVGTDPKSTIVINTRKKQNESKRSDAKILAGSCKRSGFTKDEGVAAKLFHSNFQRRCNREPDPEEIQEALQLAELKGKSLPELKLFVDNINRSPQQKKLRYTGCRNSTARKSWTPRAKRCLLDLYSSYISNNDSTDLPPLSQIRYDIASNSPLKGRSAATVKSAIHNSRKKLRYSEMQN